MIKQILLFLTSKYIKSEDTPVETIRVKEIYLEEHSKAIFAYDAKTNTYMSHAGDFPLLERNLIDLFPRVDEFKAIKI